MSDFPHQILTDVSHRPWPLPGGQWFMTQSWHDLLFAHWPVDARVLQERLPAGLLLDTFDGQAWIGIVPFRMTNVAPRGVPPVPFVSEFLELNVRTYVTLQGKPGVFFFSLDAGRLLAVLGARAMFRLPYFAASMRVTRSGDTVPDRAAAAREDADEDDTAAVRTGLRNQASGLGEESGLSPAGA